LIEFCTKLNDQTKIIDDNIELKEISKFLISFDNKIEELIELTNNFISKCNI